MPPCPETIVSIRDLNKSYRRGSQTVPVLERITFEICNGEFLALMGPSPRESNRVRVALLTNPSNVLLCQVHLRVESRGAEGFRLCKHAALLRRIRPLRLVLILT